MIVSNSDETLLTMNISGREFAKAKLMQYLNDPGYIVSWTADGSCILKTWYFTGTKEAEKEDTLYMTGPSFEGIPFYSILKDAKFKNRRFEIFEKVRSAFEQAVEQNIELPLCGPMGTIASPDGSILFLPQEYIQRSVSFLDDSESSDVYGCYYHAGINHTDSLRFMLSVYAYEIITGRLPFPKKNTEERIADYVDHNFIPAKYWNSFVSKDFSEILSHNLSISTSIKKKTKKKNAPIEDKFNEIQSIPVPSFDIHIKETDTDNYFQNEKDSAAERVKFISSLSKKIKVKRFFRQKGTMVKFASIAAALIVITAASIIKDNMDRPTTIGLTPYEVTEAFYTSLNILDVTLASITTQSSVDKGFKDMISSFYVINKMRSAYDTSSQTLHPGQWLLVNRDFADWMYGITRLTIDSTPANPFSHHHDTEVKRTPLPETNGSVEKFLVTYYLVRNEAREEIVVTEYQEEVTLVFTKNRWLISDIQSENSEYYVDTKKFFNDYLSFDADYDVYAIAQELAKTYAWIPGEKEIQAALEELNALYEQNTF